MRRLWIGLALASLVVGWIGVACSEPPDQPPPAPNGDTPVHLGGGATGSGSAASTSPCVAAHGVCMDPGDGNICPSVIAESCSIASDNEASGPIVTAQVCCTGFNDAGQPDVVVQD
jgi:hypothetical protein